MRHFNQQVIAFVITAFALSGSCLPVSADNADQIVSAIQAAKILDDGTRISATVKGGQAIISTYRHASADENDCKLEALQMGKLAMELAETELTRVSVHFYSASNAAKKTVVSISADEIKAFVANGKLSTNPTISKMKKPIGKKPSWRSVAKHQ